MPNNGKPEPMLDWTVQLRIPVPVKSARRVSKPALMKWLAKTLAKAMSAVPPEFIVQSADKIKADLEKQGRRLVAADGKPYQM